ncbi:hypothetical protein NDU88_002878 [Pleurodeles waltl]|uniref:Uncharacterized protein n=1 Tax=Pleurodeles waltl TaxID=8319 RepID=A0AAV7M1W8_PLEWA|nr:hypothetical protein NDU88_002878 [Pleurodeles waltl]
MIAGELRKRNREAVAKRCAIAYSGRQMLPLRPCLMKSGIWTRGGLRLPKDTLVGSLWALRSSASDGSAHPPETALANASPLFLGPRPAHAWSAGAARMCSLCCTEASAWPWALASSELRQ